MKKINEDFYSSGFLHFDKNGECHDKKDIARVWHVVFKYPEDEDTTVINGTTYLYCVVMTDKLTDHFWAVYPGESNPKSAEKSLPEYIVKHLPANEANANGDANREFLIPLLGGTLEDQINAIKKLIDNEDDGIFSEDEMKIIKNLYINLISKKKAQDFDDDENFMPRKMNQPEFTFREIEKLLKDLHYGNVSFQHLQVMEVKALKKLKSAFKKLGISAADIRELFGKTNATDAHRKPAYHPIDDYRSQPSDNNYE